MVVYNNPIVLQRADPWVLKVDGEYYFTASDPEYNCIAIPPSKATPICISPRWPIRGRWAASPSC